MVESWTSRTPSQERKRNNSIFFLDVPEFEGEKKEKKIISVTEKL